MADAERQAKLLSSLQTVGGLSTVEQFRRLQEAGFSLDEIGYGRPSGKTIANFGPDGRMVDPNIPPPGRTYES